MDAWAFIHDATIDDNVRYDRLPPGDCMIMIDGDVGQVTSSKEA